MRARSISTNGVAAMVGLLVWTVTAIVALAGNCCSARPTST
jgi:hypothetical protein